MSANQARSWNTNPSPNPNREPKKVAVKVKKQGWITKGEKVIYSMIAAGLIIAGVFMVSLSSQTDALNREMQELEKSVQQQQIANEGLAFEVKELSRPERIISIAESHGLTIQNAEVKQAQAVEQE
ncbi:cell division protein FtsL [Oceanobacillus alkalisoli]|uniref:cell division protein FtsL n=1 Tax=Oceanobacillus alkalisoli TaxID=2925113 RepID=UPI001EF14009|nr:cell division protein FtsL [Oceanobacillus alkalisoli]MCF3942524.1 cell division protein FtsL [Oceanobacillus alkalisoli]MCG5103581.1 cell division protein FtsL [Oceanobacillus alkalisoli]